MRKLKIKVSKHYKEYGPVHGEVTVILATLSESHKT